MRLIFFLMFCWFNSHAQNKEMYFKKNNVGDTLYLTLVNNMYGPVEVKIFPNDELKKVISAKEYFILKARDSMERAVSIPMAIIKDSSDLRFTDFAKVDLKLGLPSTKHVEDYEYALPYPKGKKYRIVQGFNGKFTHNSKKSRYAIDFNLNIGDTICAAREGIVVRTRDRFKEHGGKSLIDKANLITILHDDGTLAQYVHLDYQGVLVEPGEQVKKGQPIGISGYTGFARGAHLHFVVREAQDRSVPIYFESMGKKPLKQGKKYKRH